MFRSSVRVVVASSALAFVSAVSPSASATVLFRGDFETGDTKGWSYLLNPEGISVVASPTRDGQKAGRIEISNKNIFANGLNRVEVQHKPAANRVVEGADTYFGWSFYLPAALGPDRHQIGYWESDNSFQQVMSFTVTGQDITFETRKPNNVKHWDAKGVVTPGRWHDVVMRVHWSKSAAEGYVDVWYDGKQVVTGGKGQTIVDALNFVQIGILRDNKDAPAEVMFLDRAVEATTLEEVMAAPPPASDAGAPDGASQDGGASGAPGGSTGAPSSGSPETPSGASPEDGTGASPSAGATSPPASPTRGSAPGDTGTSCGLAPGHVAGGAPWALVGLAALVARARRRRRVR